MEGTDAPDKQQPPNKDILKLNYDGTAKGNPGVTGVGGVFRNYKGNILWIYDGNIGKATKNTVELLALEHGLDISKV